MKVRNMPERDRSFSVAIVGCGVIGSYGVTHFARIAGVDSITLVDPDSYEQRNLKAQNIRPADVGRPKVEVTAEALRAVAPGIKVTTRAERVQCVPLGILRNCDLIATCLDSKQARLSTNRIAQSINRPLVDAGVRGDSLLARVSVLPGSRGGACLECNWSPRTYGNTRYRQHCVGEATHSPSYLGALIASYQAMESDKLLSGNCEHPMGYQVILDLKHHTLSHSKLFRGAGCRCAHLPWDIRDAGGSPETLSLGDALELGRERCGPGPMGLSLYGKHVIVALRGPCGHRWPVMRLHHRTSPEHRTCPLCSARTAQDALPSPFDIEERFLETKHEALLGEPLSRFGFRPRDVLTVEGEGGCAHFELGTEDNNTDGRTADDRSGTDGFSDAAA